MRSTRTRSGSRRSPPSAILAPLAGFFYVRAGYAGRRLAALRILLRFGPGSGAASRIKRQPAPSRGFGWVFEPFLRHEPVARRDRFHPLAVDKGPGPGALEGRPVLVIDLKVKLVRGDKGEHAIVQVDALSAEHRADANGAEFLEQVS